MRYQLLCNTLGLVTFIFIVNIVPVVGQVNKSTINPNRTTFLCVQRRDPASGVTVPNTIAWIPHRGNVRFIIWKSTLFSTSWNPEKRCQEVTKKFQKAYDSGKLHYFKKGKLNGYTIICAVKTDRDVCNSDNELFIIKCSNPDAVVRKLTSVLKGAASSGIMQGSDLGVSEL